MKAVKHIIIALGALVLAACGNVNMVKDGTLDYDTSLTVGEAFENYRYFDSVAWSEFETDNGRDVVQVDGVFTDEYMTTQPAFQAFNGATLKVQFIVNKDNTFVLHNISIDFEKKDGTNQEVDLADTMTDNQLDTMLYELYNNEPLS